MIADGLAHKRVSSVAKDNFYSSLEWLKVRAQVLKRDNYRCVRCGADVRGKGKARVDHIKERKKFPALALVLSNLRTLCITCDGRRHRDKGRAALEARGVRINRPERQATGPDGLPVDDNSDFYKH